MITIDAREPPYNIDKIIKASPESTKEFIETGDYLLPGGFAIERKKGRDFLGSLLTKRLFEQLNNLCQYDFPIIAVITDNIWRDFYYSHSRYIHNVYIGVMSTIIAKYPKVRIVQFDDDDRFIDFLLSLDKKLTEEGKSESPKQFFKKPTSIQDRRENSLSAIQGVSIGKAKTLLGTKKSIKNICNSSIDELKEIEGIGPTLAKNIWETLN